MFEAAGGLDIGTQFVCESAMETQLQSAPDSLQRSFAGLMLNYAKGDAIDNGISSRLFHFPNDFGPRLHNAARRPCLRREVSKGPRNLSNREDARKSHRHMLKFEMKLLDCGRRPARPPSGARAAH